MNKDNNMRNFSLALYEGTIDKLLELKEDRGWTHDQMQNELIDTYRQIYVVNKLIAAYDELEQDDKKGKE